MTESLQSCLTCRRKTDNFLRISDEANVEDIGTILEKHFWFQAEQYDNRILCTSCWEKIEDFHKFYCDVQQLWAPDRLPDGIAIKTEELSNEGDQLACELVCTEDDAKNEQTLEMDIDAVDDECEEFLKNEKENSPLDDEMATENEDEPTAADDSEEDSEIPIARRCRSVKRKATSTLSCGKSTRKPRHVNSQRKMNSERNDLIAKYVQLRCDVCDHRSTTLSRLLLHYKRDHDMQGYVTCCDRNFQKKSTLFEHLCKHENGSDDKEKSPFQCIRCEPTRAFKDEEGLQLHNVVCHSELSEKNFKCDQCEKAFASEWQLSGHKNWHQNVESLNIFCDKCNKYFNSVRTLNTHIRAHHLEVGTTLTLPTSGTIMDNVLQIPTDATIPEPIIASADQALVATETADSSEIISQMPRVATVSSRKTLKSLDEIAQQDDLIRKFCSLICEKCEFVGDNYYQLDKHYKTDHNMRGYAVCCGRKFCKKRRLFEHCQRHVNPDMFRCELCNKSFTESDGLDKHNKWVHTPDSEKPFKCEICDAAFYKDYLLRNHMKYHISMEQKIFNCKDCDKSFGTAVLLRAHQQNIHGAAFSWVCDICAKGFVHKSLLETHRLSHTEEGAASLKKQCEHCKKWLKNKDTYMNHLKRCLAGGPVACDICGKEAVNELALASHKRFNHEERPSFACSYCGKQFKRVLRLKEHEANHRGEVLYTCPYCPRTCNSSSNMYTHKKVAHPELWAAKVADRFYKR
ncbi:hypothetical protein RP20_CCG020603 [Aedes albopictus]|nr:hypothetical protein RP20_CCG020603 [Aedes albopictus]